MPRVVRTEVKCKLTVGYPARGTLATESSKGFERGADGVRRGTARTRKIPSAISGTVEGDRRGVVPPAQFTVPGKQSLKQALKKGKTPVHPPSRLGSEVPS